MGQRHLGQPPGEQQPAVVRDHADGSPALVEQGFDPVGDGLDLVFEVPREIALERVPELVELPGLDPASRHRSCGQTQVSFVHDLDAGLRHGIPQLARQGDLTAFPKHGLEIHRPFPAFQEVTDRSGRRLGGGGHRGHSG